MRIQLASQVGGADPVQQPRDRYLHVVRISEEAFTIGERQLEGLGDQVERFGGALLRFSESRALQEMQGQGKDRSLTCGLRGSAQQHL